jgi:hypothetical protein
VDWSQVPKHPLLVRLESALFALGTEPDDIASRLAQEGHFGGSHNTSCPLARYLKEALASCPLARYLKEALGGESLVSVSGETALVVAHNVTCVLPRPVKLFVLQHDQGRYPFLRPRYKPLEPDDVP